VLRILSSVVVAVLLVVGCGSDDNDSGEASPEEVALSYPEAYNTHDIDATMAVFADDVVVVDFAEGGLREEMLAEFEGDPTLTWTVECVDGNTVTVASTWDGGGGGTNDSFGEVVVEDGKIAIWRFDTAGCAE
jgi:hypothetical protein